MLGMFGKIKGKNCPAANEDRATENPYAVVAEFPRAEEMLFDGKLKLLLMDG
jgi:hypothetical protein